MTEEQKQQAHEILIKRVPWHLDQLNSVDHRLGEYFMHLADHPSMHNGYELLGGVKYLRLLRSYEFDTDRVQQVIGLREGEWRQADDGRWVHVRVASDAQERTPRMSIAGSRSRCSFWHLCSGSRLGSILR